jgi:hypothetical protein
MWHGHRHGSESGRMYTRAHVVLRKSEVVWLQQRDTEEVWVVTLCKPHAEASPSVMLSRSSA